MRFTKLIGKSIGLFYEMKNFIRVDFKNACLCQSSVDIIVIENKDLWFLPYTHEADIYADLMKYVNSILYLRR